MLVVTQRLLFSSWFTGKGAQDVQATVLNGTIVVSFGESILSLVTEISSPTEFKVARAGEKKSMNELLSRLVKNHFHLLILRFLYFLVEGG